MDCLGHAFRNSFNFMFTNTFLGGLLAQFNVNLGGFYQYNNPFNYSNSIWSGFNPFMPNYYPATFDFSKMYQSTFDYSKISQPTIDYSSIWNTTPLDKIYSPIFTTKPNNGYSISDNLMDFYEDLGFTRSSSTSSTSTSTTSTSSSASSSTGSGKKTRTRSTQVTSSTVESIQIKKASDYSNKIGEDYHQYDALIIKYAKKYDVDPALVKAVIKAESTFNPNAQSKIKKKDGTVVDGAQGLMQLMPKTAASLGVTDSFDPEQNIAGGVKYLKQLLDRYNGNVEKTVAAYNCGMGYLDKHGLENLPSETKKYLPKVLSFYKEYQLA